MKNRSISFILASLFILSVFVLTGCQSRVSDSGRTQMTFGTNIDNKIYNLDVTMLGSPQSNLETNAVSTERQYSDIYGYGNMRLWQDGKGLVLVHVNSISPSLKYIQPDTDVVLKTTDLKIMAIEPGYRFRIKCRSDFEPIASLKDNEMISSDYDTYELDFCRMVDPNIVYSEAAD